MRAAVDPQGQLGERLAVVARAPREMPAAIRGHSSSAMFYAGGEISELGRSPTRMAEVLGCGAPVVVNEGVGDVARIVREHRVGVVLEGPEEKLIVAAMRKFAELAADPDLPTRCREAAEQIFSLKTGTEAYRSLYRRVLAGHEMSESGTDRRARVTQS